MNERRAWAEPCLVWVGGESVASAVQSHHVAPRMPVSLMGQS